MHVAIDARRAGFFGIGTYIRNLISALSQLDQTNRYTIITLPYFLKQLRADLYHIPLNSVAYLMPRPYVVTIHDLSSITYKAAGGFKEALHRERYRRGAKRAARVIAVSNATRRDLQSVVGI